MFCGVGLLLVFTVLRPLKARPKRPSAGSVWNLGLMDVATSTACLVTEMGPTLTVSE